MSISYKERLSLPGVHLKIGSDSLLRFLADSVSRTSRDIVYDMNA